MPQVRKPPKTVGAFENPIDDERAERGRSFPAIQIKDLDRVSFI